MKSPAGNVITMTPTADNVITMKPTAGNVMMNAVNLVGLAIKSVVNKYTLIKQNIFQRTFNV